MGHCYVLVKITQLFDKEALLKHDELALRTTRRKYQVTSKRKNIGFFFKYFNVSKENICNPLLLQRRLGSLVNYCISTSTSVSRCLNCLDRHQSPEKLRFYQKHGSHGHGSHHNVTSAQKQFSIFKVKDPNRLKTCKKRFFSSS